jgi:hypothetical protein
MARASKTTCRSCKVWKDYKPCKNGCQSGSRLSGFTHAGHGDAGRRADQQEADLRLVEEQPDHHTDHGQQRGDQRALAADAVDQQAEAIGADDVGDLPVPDTLPISAGRGC